MIVSWSPKQQLTLVIISQLLLTMATSLSQPYWPLILQTFIASHNSSFAVWNMLIYCSPLLCAALAATFWGHMGDRFGYKTIFLRASICLLATQILLLFASSPLMILVCRIFQGLFSGSVAASQALGTCLLDRSKKAMVLAKLQSTVSLGMIIGPVIGGYCFSHFQVSSLFSTAILLALAGVLIISFGISEPQRHDSLTEERSTNSTHPHLALALLNAAILLSQAARFMIVPVIAIYVTHLLHQSVEMISIVYITTSISFLVCAPLGARFFMKLNDLQPWLPLTALLMAGVLNLMLINVNQIYWVLSNRLLWGICLACVTPLLYTLRLTISKQQHGRVIGSASSANKLGCLLGTLLGNVVYFKLSMNMLFVTIAICYFIATLCVFWATQSLSFRYGLARTTHG